MYLALIGLFADQSSLFATLVYQYDFTPDKNSYYPRKDLPSGTIQFLESSGSGGLESIYALSITSMPSGTTDGFGNPLPLIPATTFNLSQADSFRGTIKWGYDSFYDRELLNIVLWNIGFNPNGDGFTVDVNSGEIATFFPQKYYFNEIPIYGDWKFSGKRNVPEAGSTLLYLAIGMIILSSAGIKRLAWRNQ